MNCGFGQIIQWRPTDLQASEGYVHVRHSQRTTLLLRTLQNNICVNWGFLTRDVAWHVFGLCYCNYQIFSLTPLSLHLLGGQGSLFTALCSSVCVWLWENSPLSVRVPRSLDRHFPWGPLYSETLSPTTALGPSSSQQPLVVTRRIHFLCFLTWKRI